MTPRQRRQYSTQYINRLKRWENKYRAAIKRGLQSQINDFIAVLKKRGKDAALRSLETVLLNEDIAATISRMYVEVGITTGNLTLREINQSASKVTKARGFGFDARWQSSILQYFREYLLDSAVVPITETTKEQIRKIMEEAELNGWSIDKIIYELQSSSITDARARLIVRTELNKATFFGRKLGEEESEWETNKEWIAANDHRTRSDHRQVDGTVIDEEQNFIVGGEPMEGPGDPKASAKQNCNCRCSLATIAARDANGRLIPKQKSSVVIIRPDQVSRPTRIFTI